MNQATYVPEPADARPGPRNRAAGPDVVLPLAPSSPTAEQGGAVKLRILLPFTCLLVFVIGVFLVSTYLAEERSRQLELSEHVQAVQRLFRHEIDEEFSLMHGTLDAITQDMELKAAMIAGDRDAIWRMVQPLFEGLKQDHNVSHFYFIGPDRKTLLRLHQTGVHGDRIDRATTLRAQRTRRIAYGIELGRLGTLTLRAVLPWMEGERLIGFVELGHDIGQFMEEIHQILGVDILAMVYKKYMDKDGWAMGAASREHAWSWDRFDTTVIVARTIGLVPDALNSLLEEDGHPYETIVPLQEDGELAHVAFLPLHDAAGREVGDFVVIREVTEEQAAFRNSMLLTVAMSVLAGSAVFILFVITLRRVERDYRRKREVEAQFSKLSREHERIVQVEKLSAIGTMIGEIAHQINNPLVGVVNMAQLAQREADDPDRTRKLLGDIVNAGKHCHAFVKRMVEFTKISRSQYERVEIRKLIEDTIFLFRQSATHHPSVNTEFPEHTVSLDVDPIMIRHALFNLLSNAAQANDETADEENVRESAGASGEAIAVRLFRKVRDKDGAGGWCIAVEDQGPGLSEDLRQNMFTPFFTTRPEGTGLGLPVVQYVAKLHDGEINGVNRPGGGARFCLWLPENRPEDEYETQDSHRR